MYAYLSPSDPGACFLCNDCPSDEDSDSADPASCPSRPRGEGSSSCVETTAYALRALLAVGDREKTVCLAQWLVQIKSGSGGFYSSQVSYSKQTFTGIASVMPKFHTVFFAYMDFVLSEAVAYMDFVLSIPFWGCSLYHNDLW